MHYITCLGMYLLLQNHHPTLVFMLIQQGILENGYLEEENISTNPN